MVDSSSSPSAADPVPMASQDNMKMLSSPPRSSQSMAGASGKERRQPSITPRKFRRFFTPRVSTNPTAARRALRDLTARALNNSQTTPSSSPFHFSSSPLAAYHDKNDANDATTNDGLLSLRSAKKRKTGHQTPETSPLRPFSAAFVDMIITPEPKTKMFATSMLPSPLASSPLPAIKDDEPMSDGDDYNITDDAEAELSFRDPPLKKIVRLGERGLSTQLFQRQLGSLAGTGNRQLHRPVADWRIETTDFYSSHQDLHICSSNEIPNGQCIPFCAAACNANGLVAIGDEEGRIRLLDSAQQGPDGFSNIYLSFPTHSNAVIDLAFSDDDYLLATASGDQTGKVIDMMTQTPISILDHHTASLKQVRFQPGKGEGNVLATSSRDGSIKIWDLRCKGGPAQDITMERPNGLQYNLPRKVSQGCVVNSIYDAHARTTRLPRQTRKMMQAAVAADVITRWEEPGRVGEVSVTAIQFLPAGKEHLLLSACEADASIKLWDIRNVHTSRQKTSSTPLSFTAPPESHTQWRPFGMSSMSLSTDGARLYSLCKDNTVYAYSTSHLMLGTAPELSSKAADHPRRRNGVVQEGLGPIYGFRHGQFHATSFYVKTAVRPAQNGCPEMLAVGSSDGSPVLFPTDERYFLGDFGDMYEDNVRSSGQERSSTPIFASARASDNETNHSSSSIAGSAPRRPGGLFRTNSMSSMQGGSGGGRLVDTIPIVRNGTALVHGHEQKEVGAVCWTNDGSLVSVGDDHYIRCWREDRHRAADLRTGGERDGRRWLTGWADAGSDDWDKDEDEWMEE